MKPSARTRPADSATHQPSSFHRNPLRWGFTVTLGVLLALLLASVAVTLNQVLLSVFIAAFIALGLDPLVRWLEGRNVPRVGALLIVIGLVIAVIVFVVSLLVPPVVTQAVSFVTGLPDQIAGLAEEEWFIQLNESTNGAASSLLAGLSSLLTLPEFWASIGGGALQLTVSIANAVTFGVFVLVLTIYFIGTLDTIKHSGYSLVSRSKRDDVQHYGDQILASVGTYLSGMVVLAFMNAVFSTILMSVVGIPYAILYGVVIFFITLIPLVGSVITASLMTVIALFQSPMTALIVGVTMLVYIQIEAYVLTPRVMSKAVQVPGSVVLISALAGGTLAGLLGALVAIPISAGILLIVKQVVIPARELR